MTHAEAWLQFARSINPDISAQSALLIDEIRTVWLKLHHLREDTVTNAGISYARYRLLMSLFYCAEVEGKPALNPSQISQRQGTSRNTISALIRELEGEGLIERELDETDRRKFNIRLTDAGRQKVRAHASRHLQMVSDCFQPLTPTEQETLLNLLRKVSENL